MAAFPSLRWPALGTTVVVLVGDARELEPAGRAVRRVLDEVDRACSRFRDDSELVRLNAAGGAPTHVSPMFARATACALRAARITDGDLDPTVGASLQVAGYDRDFAALRPGGVVRFRRAAGWRGVQFDEARAVVRLARGMALDFGATAKALAVDLAAEAVGVRIEGGALVSVGGDIATVGEAPFGGWPVHASDSHAVIDDASGQTIALRTGGLATSSTTVRRWRRAGVDLHHILDPGTGAPAREYWRTATVAAACCVDANIASTTAIIRGEAAPAWLAGLGLPSRLVAVDGRVTSTVGWPAQRGGVVC